MEAEIDQLLAWEDETARVTITDIEDQVLAARARLSKRMMESLTQRRATRIDLSQPEPASVRGKLHYKGKKTKSVKHGAG